MEQFPRFDVVSDYSDHAFAYSLSDMHPTATNAVLKEWKILKKSLPERIHVRVYSGRDDLLRAVIIGPQKTPYHDSLFFFDFKFPKNYPHMPPLVYFHSFGLCLNSKLHTNGHVCLSLLNTWPGPSESRWRPKVSTMLQVLISIQNHVFREWPYYNEPDPIRLGSTPPNYNNTTFIQSCKIMLYLLRRPPKNFETFVSQHFSDRARAILTSCQVYLNGFARVGSFEYRADTCPFDLDQKNRLVVDSRFARHLEKQYGLLLREFSKHDPPLIGFSEELHRTVKDAKRIMFPTPGPHPKPSKMNLAFRKIFGWFIQCLSPN